jgi:hypothetical protein
MLEHTDKDRAKALRNAEYASLTRRAVTANSHALIDEVYQRVAEYEIQNGLRKRKRVDKAREFIHALEGFVGDLLEALGQKERTGGWVYRAVTPRSFTNDGVSFGDFEALRKSLVSLALVEEVPAVQFWGHFGSGPFVAKRFATRFRATEQFEKLATAHGVSPSMLANISSLTSPNPWCSRAARDTPRRATRYPVSR